MLSRNERMNWLLKEGAAEWRQLKYRLCSVDGVEFDGGKGENHSLNLPIPGFNWSEQKLVMAKLKQLSQKTVTDLAGKLLYLLLKLTS